MLALEDNSRSQQQMVLLTPFLGSERAGISQAPSSRARQHLGSPLLRARG